MAAKKGLSTKSIIIGTIVVALLGAIAFMVVKKKAQDAWVAQIKSTPEWMESIKAKAIAQGNTIEQQLVLNAIYMMKTESLFP